MDNKKALLTIIIILAFALIATSLSQLTGFSVNSPTTITISPSSILPGDTVTITVNPGQNIKEELTVYRSPAMVRVDTINLDCGGYKCDKGEVKSTTYRTDVSEQSSRLIVKVYNTNGEEAGSGSFNIL